jgi:hypothetical protein
MPAVYAEVAGSRGVAPARMMMYAARPRVIELAGTPKPWKNDQYFTQRLLPDFMRAHPKLTADWNVAFDDRGHFTEPHTGTRIGIGTLGVRRYVRGWDAPAPSGEVAPIRLSREYPTSGPKNRFRFALFIEKEGFDELLAQADIEERYDVRPDEHEGDDGDRRAAAHRVAVGGRVDAAGVARLRQERAGYPALDLHLEPPLHLRRQPAPT